MTGMVGSVKFDTARLRDANEHGRRAGDLLALLGRGAGYAWSATAEGASPQAAPAMIA